MTTPPSARPPARGRWMGAILATLLGWVAASGILGPQLRTWSYEAPWWFRNPPAPRDVIIVYMDADSERVLGQPAEARWDRKIHAQLLRRLQEDGSRTVLFDVVFDRPSTNAADDQIFADAIRAHGRVVLGIDYARTGDGGGTGLGAGWKANRPIPLLATNAAGLGLVQVVPDPEPVVRRLFPGMPRGPGGQPWPTMIWKAAELEGAPVARTTAGMEREFWLNYYGGPGKIEHVSYYRALNRLVPPGTFRGKVVLVGVQPQIGYTGAGKDTFDSPGALGGQSHFAGVEIHATGLANLLHSEWLRAVPLFLELPLLALLGAGLGMLLVRFRPLPATLVAVGTALAVALAALLAAAYLHLWFSWLVVVLVQIPLAWAWAVLFQWVQAQLQNQRLELQSQFLERSLASYLSPKLAKKFVRDKDLSLLRPGATKQKLTILFSDIAGFTSVSEGMDSDELARMMNEYFERAVGGCVHATDGTVVKYIGDAIFAFWNAPEPQADHAVRACEAALLFRAMSSTEVRGKKLITRIGLHTGSANVGNFGSATRVDYTALGEDVNLASRMEGLNKHLGTNVLLTGAVRAEIGGEFLTRYLGRFQLKGFERAVEVHELLARARDSDTVLLRREDFAAALRLFQNRELEAAEAAFRRLHEAQPEDGCTEFYLHHLAGLRAAPPPPEWRGEIELKEK